MFLECSSHLFGPLKTSILVIVCSYKKLYFSIRKWNFYYVGYFLLSSKFEILVTGQIAWLWNLKLLMYIQIGCQVSNQVTIAAIAFVLFLVINLYFVLISVVNSCVYFVEHFFFFFLYFKKTKQNVEVILSII